MSQIDRDEFQRLVHDLVNREGINLERKGRITESMSLEDLGLDSIRRAHFLMGLESALGIAITKERKSLSMTTVLNWLVLLGTCVP